MTRAAPLLGLVAVVVPAEAHEPSKAAPRRPGCARTVSAPLVGGALGGGLWYHVRSERELRASAAKTSVAFDGSSLYFARTF